MHYKSKIKNWYTYSSVRKKPRRILTDDIDGYFYPVARQPISVHPIVMDLGEDALKFVLIQSAYKFMRDIAYVEVEVINQICNKIYSNKYPLKFSDEIRIDILSVIIDETFHAYAALDYIKQVENSTGISPLEKNPETELSISIKKFKSLLREDLREIFELIAGCIGENTLTKELFSMTNEKGVNKFFHDIMHDHMLDEGRHSRIFEDILSIVWSNLNNEDKESIGEVLPEFLFSYLSPSLDISYSREILKALKLDKNQIEEIIIDTYPEHTLANFKYRNPIVSNIIKMLERADLFSCMHTRAAFQKLNLM